MNRLTRLVDWAASFSFVVGIVGILIFMIGMLLLPIGGPLGILLFSVWLLRRWNRKRRRDWSHDVHGENAYQILGVGQYADNATIQHAFRELGRKFHPDSVPSEKREEATAAFVRIEQAYEILSDTNHRYEYDSLIDRGEGMIPSFEEAYLHIRRELAHPMYAEYDLLFPPGKKSMPEPVSDREAECGEKSTKPVGSERVEVEIPDSVREALGLPD